MKICDMCPFFGPKFGMLGYNKPLQYIERANLTKNIEFTPSKAILAHLFWVAPPFLFFDVSLT